MWEQLPELILIQVFDKLGNRDRASAARVCSHWAYCLGSPSLWRRCKIRIDVDLNLDYSLVFQLLLKYGEHMRSLELAWSQPDNRPRERRVARSYEVDAGADFVALARCQDVQLRELILTDWMHGPKWGNCAKLLCQLANLLACQRNLQKFSLFNANLKLADVLRLIAIVAKVCSTRLASLDLRGAFREWRTPLNNSRYLKLLGRLHALADLSLDYPALSDGALNALASGAPKVLRSLQVWLRDSDSRQHRIENSAWRNLADACPNLTVAYTIINISHHEDMCYLLLPNVPLVKFRMFGDKVWDQSRTRNFRGTVGLLISYYTKTLAEVVLQFNNNREMLDDLLISMLTHCKRLKNLQYDGIMRNLETIREICQLQADYKTCYERIHVKSRNLNTYNRALLHDINHQFNREMFKQGIDFCIENSN